MDWNDDGLTDLIVGEHNGHVKYFMAVTPDSLTEMDDLQAAGEDINAGLVSAPVVFDWNNDSLDDLIVGFASPVSGSTIKLYLNEGTQSNPILAEGVDVLCGGSPVGAYSCAPCFFDLDQDGLVDIIYGEGPGGIHFCKNIGTASAPVFASPEPLESEDGIISFDLNTSPFVADWNDDGFPDLLAGCGEKGYLYAFLSPYTTGISSQSSGQNSFSFDLCRNPVSSSISINVNSNASRTVNCSLFNTAGRVCQNFGSSELTDGQTSLQFTASPQPPGIYLLRLSSGEESSSKLITIIGGAR